MERNQPNVDRGGLNADWNADNPQHTGLTTLMDAVQDVHFPVNKQQLIDQKGDETVNLTGHQPEKLRVLLLRTDADDFLSVTDLVQKLEGAF